MTIHQSQHEHQDSGEPHHTPQPDRSLMVKPGRPAGEMLSGEDALEIVENELSCLWRRERALSLQVANRIHPTLGPGSYRLLVVLLQRAPIRVTDIATALDVRKATISRHITHLESLGFITRRMDPHDRRAHFLGLTAEGFRTVTEVQRQRQDEFRRTFLQWTPTDIADLTSLLDRLNTMKVTDT